MLEKRSQIAKGRPQRLPFALLWIAFGLTFCQVLLPQDPLSVFPSSDSRERLVRGHVVLYDWSMHLQWANEDLVVKTADPKMPFVRVVYLPACCFDAPPVPVNDLFPHEALEATGREWEFLVHNPHWDWDKETCKANIAPVKFIDENGKAMKEEPRFKSTPGAEVEKVPPIQTLPCFILKVRGWSPAKTEKTADGTSRGAKSNH